MPPSPHGARLRARSASRRRAAPSVSRCSRRRSPEGSASPRSCRSGTRPTSRRTTCSSGGRTTRPPRSCCSTSSRSATRAGSGGIARRVARRKPVLALKSGVDGDRAARRELAHGGARGLGRSSRHALPSGRRDSRGVPGGADRRRRAALEPARAEGPAGRDPHERRRPRDPVRGRVRCRRSRAAGARRRDARARRCAISPRKRASRTPSTCSAARPRRRTSACCRSCSSRPRSTPSSSSSSRP